MEVITINITSWVVLKMENISVFMHTKKIFNCTYSAYSGSDTSIGSGDTVVKKSRQELLPSWDLFYSNGKSNFAIGPRSDMDPIKL